MRAKKKSTAISDRRQSFKFSFGAHARMGKSLHSTEAKVVISKSPFSSNTYIATSAENVTSGMECPQKYFPAVSM